MGANNYEAYFQQASAKYGVDENLLKSVAKAESSFNPSAISNAGAVGIMQLMPDTAKELGVKDSFDPYENIMGGAKYLSQMLKQFNGNVSYALAGYNAGPDAVTKYNGIPPYAETQNYVTTVLGYFKEFGGSIVDAVTSSTSSTAATPVNTNSSNLVMDALGGNIHAGLIRIILIIGVFIILIVAVFKLIGQTDAGGEMIENGKKAAKTAAMAAAM